MAMICISGARECDGCCLCHQEPRPPVCPICGAECETLYRTKDYEVLGCENCVNTIDAWEYQNENEEE